MLQAAGIERSEDWLIQQIGTSTAGTNHCGLITPVLNALLPGSGYKVEWLTKDPATAAQVEALWKNVSRSINADTPRGCILNFVSPPWNRPKGTRGSVSPDYRGNNTIYHYVACMGVVDDGPGGRHFWIADPGFPPHGFWCSVEQVAQLIVPHSYAYAADVVVSAKPKTEPATAAAAIKQPDWDAVWLTHIDHLAVTYGDVDAVGWLVKAAKTDSRAKRALARLENTNPAALQQFLATKG